MAHAHGDKTHKLTLLANGHTEHVSDEELAAIENELESLA